MTEKYHYRIIDVNDENHEYLCESAQELNDLIADIIEHLADDEAAVLDIRVIELDQQDG